MAGEQEQLVRMARLGDDEAFGRLIRPCIDPSYRLALRMLEDASEAEDAVQEALYKAWRGLARFRGDAAFSTWVYRIVWTECVDRARRRPRVPIPMEDAEERARGGGGDDPVRRAERRERRDAVERALQSLSPPYRAVLTLFYMEDLAIKDIARILDWPLGTVKTRLHRARRALRRALQGTDLEREEGGADGAR